MTLKQIMYSPILFDTIFAVAGAISIVGLAMSTGNAMPAIEAADNAFAKGGALVVLVLAGVLLATHSTRLDQRCADDYLFMTLAKSAFIGMMAFILASAFWEALFADNLGRISSYATLGVAVAAWSLAYFYTRIRGTGA